MGFKEWEFQQIVIWRQNVSGWGKNTRYSEAADQGAHFNSNPLSYEEKQQWGKPGMWDEIKVWGGLRTRQKTMDFLMTMIVHPADEKKKQTLHYKENY